MKRIIISFVPILFILLLIVGCADETIELRDNNLDADFILPRTGEENIFVTGIGGLEDTAIDYTILGAVRANPYTVENFSAAYNELYDPDITSVSATHYYIQFNPATHEQLELLVNSDLNVVEFPLDREIIHLGEIYLEPGRAAGDIVPFYGVVELSRDLPEIPYTILSILHLGSKDEDLIRRALERKGFNPDEIGYIIPPDDDEGGGGGGGGGGIYTTNACGCQVYTDTRKPGGCIRVNDVEKSSFEGVRRVRVVIKDNFFDFHTVYTDDNGCFKVNSRFFGNAYMWVHFNSEYRVKVRGVKTGIASIIQWAFPVKHHLNTIHGPNYSNIQVRYNMWNNQGSDAHVYWGAATVGNALHEFYDYAISDGINTPPSKLDIFVGKQNSYGYALMSGQDDLVASIVAVPGVLSTIFLFPFGPVITLVGSAVLAVYLPDVYVGIDYRNSDQLKQLAFHEIAHSSHFTNVNEIYWDNLVWSEILAGGHGNQNSLNADRIAIAESWAEYIGFSFAQRTYPISGQNTAFFGSWQNEAELTRNESENHIPIGFYHDLSDINSESVQVWDQDFIHRGPINDQCSGITNSQMFSVLDPLTTSPLIFKDRLLLGQPVSIHSQINSLFESY